MAGAAVLLVAVLEGLGCSAVAATFYVSPDGDDRRSGLSPAEAWCSVEKINTLSLRAGDCVLLEGGKKHWGSIQLDADDGGTADAPVRIGSYRLREAGRAIVESGNDSGIHALNTGGLLIENLNIVGSGARSNQKSGIALYTTSPEGRAHLRVLNVSVSGFGRHGLSLGAWKTNRGYSDVQISRSRFHDNLKTGIMTWGPWGKGIYAHRRIHIDHCHAYRMNGGSGITLSSVDGGVVEHCVAHHNGREFSGAAGIWAWDSNDILFQYNESFSNKTLGVDGDGFDFDGGVTNSVMQYNYSHDNDAAGFLLAQYEYAPQPMSNIVVRYNISENDCRKKGYGAIHVWNGDKPGSIENVAIYNNTVYLGKSTGDEPSAVAIVSPTGKIMLANNLFVTEGGGKLISLAATAAHVWFSGNGYWTNGGPVCVDWRGRNYSSIARWLLAEKEQERIGTKAAAVFADPHLLKPGMAGPIDGRDFRAALAPYRLAPHSPMLTGGINLSEYGLEPGSHCLFGNPILERESIGAYAVEAEGEGITPL